MPGIVGGFALNELPGSGALFEPDLIAYLNTLLGIPVYRQKIPQRVAEPRLPCVVLSLISCTRPKGLTGSVGRAQPVYQFDVEGKTPLEVDSYGEALRQLLDNFKGEMGNSVVRLCTIENESHTQEIEIDGSDQSTWIRSYRFLFWYDEPRGNPRD